MVLVILFNFTIKQKRFGVGRVPLLLGGKAALFYCGTLCAFQKHVIISYLQALSNQKHVHSVRVIPSKQHTCRYNSTEEDKDSKRTNFKLLRI